MNCSDSQSSRKNTFFKQNGSSLSRHVNATMGDSLLRDRIVLGIKNEEARKRLLQQRKPDLKKCIDICRTSESATANLQAIRGKHNEVDQVNSGTNDSRETGDKQRESTGSSSERKNIQPRKLKCKFAYNLTF